MVEECWGTFVGFGERRSRQKQQNQGQRADIRLVFGDGCCWVNGNDNNWISSWSRGAVYISILGPLGRTRSLVQQEQAFNKAVNTCSSAMVPVVLVTCIRGVHQG